MKMNRLKYWVAPAAIVTLGLVAPMASAEDAPAEAAPPAGPNLDAVLSDLAKIGPDQLIAHVEALKAQIGTLKTEAEAAQKGSGRSH